MGLKLWDIGVEREALEVECDSGAHGDKVRRAWFECGSHSNNLWLAMVAGWTERRNAKGAWLCPQTPERLDGLVQTVVPGVEPARQRH